MVSERADGRRRHDFSAGQCVFKYRGMGGIVVIRVCTGSISLPTARVVRSEHSPTMWHRKRSLELDHVGKVKVFGSQK